MVQLSLTPFGIPNQCFLEDKPQVFFFLSSKIMWIHYLNLNKIRRNIFYKGMYWVAILKGVSNSHFSLQPKTKDKFYYQLSQQYFKNEPNKIFNILYASFFFLILCFWVYLSQQDGVREDSVSKLSTRLKTIQAFMVNGCSWNICGLIVFVKIEY